MTSQISSKSDWSVIVPVRDFATAKTRLRTDLPSASVAAIARQLALGCVAALSGSLGVSRICVVTDVDLSPHFVGLPAQVLLQRPGGGLNGAAMDGVEWARLAAPCSPTLVIHADLPVVTPTDVEGLLAKLEHGGRDAYLPDRNGTGTTALALMPGSTRPPSFGLGSAERHAQLGYARLDLPETSGLRNDLDTVAELRALRSGAGMGAALPWLAALAA